MIDPSDPFWSIRLALYGGGWLIALGFVIRPDVMIWLLSYGGRIKTDISPRAIRIQRVVCAAFVVALPVILANNFLKFMP